MYDLAYMYGYKPKATALSTSNIDIFQLVPSKIINGTATPDFDYALFFPERTPITSTGTSEVSFTIEDPIDFTISSSQDTTEITVAQISNNIPSFYLLKKKRKASSGEIKTTSFSFGTHEQFPTVEISGENIAYILDVKDSDGNTWYEVDYLGQDSVYDSVKNTNPNTSNIDIEDDAPNILILKQVQRRFATRFIDNRTLQLQFGSGNANDNDEEIVPNPNNVGLGLPYEQAKLTTAFSPTNFIFTNTYGIAPSNTTLTVRYITGGGVQSNVDANSLTNINTNNVVFLKNNLNATTSQYIFDSIASNNPSAATGGSSGDSIKQIRENSISNFSTQ